MGGGSLGEAPRTWGPEAPWLAQMPVAARAGLTAAGGAGSEVAGCSGVRWALQTPAPPLGDRLRLGRGGAGPGAPFSESHGSGGRVRSRTARSWPVLQDGPRPSCTSGPAPALGGGRATHPGAPLTPSTRENGGQGPAAQGPGAGPWGGGRAKPGSSTTGVGPSAPDPGPPPAPRPGPLEGDVQRVGVNARPPALRPSCAAPPPVTTPHPRSACPAQRACGQQPPTSTPPRGDLQPRPPRSRGLLAPRGPLCLPAPPQDLSLSPCPDPWGQPASACRARPSSLPEASGTHRAVSLLLLLSALCQDGCRPGDSQSTAQWHPVGPSTSNASRPDDGCQRAGVRREVGVSCPRTGLDPAPGRCTAPWIQAGA